MLAQIIVSLVLPWALEVIFIWKILSFWKKMQKFCFRNLFKNNEKKSILFILLHFLNIVL